MCIVYTHTHFASLHVWKLLWDSRHFEFYLVGSSIFLCFYKYSTGLFYDTIKLFRNSLILLGQSLGYIQFLKKSIHLFWGKFLPGFGENNVNDYDPLFAHH